MRPLCHLRPVISHNSSSSISSWQFWPHQTPYRSRPNASSDLTKKRMKSMNYCCDWWLAEKKNSQLLSSYQLWVCLPPSPLHSRMTSYYSGCCHSRCRRFSDFFASGFEFPWRHLPKFRTGHSAVRFSATQIVWPNFSSVEGTWDEDEEELRAMKWSIWSCKLPKSSSL